MVWDQHTARAVEIIEASGLRGAFQLADGVYSALCDGIATALRERHAAPPLRAVLAGQAMQGLLASLAHPHAVATSEPDYAVLARCALKSADALLAELAKPGEAPR